MITLNDISLNKAVTPIVEGIIGQDFAARRIAPVVEVDDDEYAYRVYTKDHLRLTDTRVGERTKAQPLDLGMSWATGKTTDHAGELFLPEKVLRKGAKAGLQLAMEEAEAGAETMNIEEEYALAVQMTDTSVMTAYDDSITAWDGASGDPAKDLDEKALLVRAAIGRMPNQLIVTPDVYLCLIRDYVRQLDGFGAQGGLQAVIEYFGREWLKEVVVTGAVYNSAAKGQTATLTGVWGSKNAWLAYKAETASKSAPSFASTFVTKGSTFTDGEPSKNPRGQFVYLHRNYEVKLRNVTAAYYLDGVLA